MTKLKFPFSYQNKTTKPVLRLVMLSSCSLQSREIGNFHSLQKRERNFQFLKTDPVSGYEKQTRKPLVKKFHYSSGSFSEFERVISSNKRTYCKNLNNEIITLGINIAFHKAGIRHIQNWLQPILKWLNNKGVCDIKYQEWLPPPYTGIYHPTVTSHLWLILQNHHTLYKDVTCVIYLYNSER